MHPYNYNTTTFPAVYQLRLRTKEAGDQYSPGIPREILPAEGSASFYDPELVNFTEMLQSRSIYTVCLEKPTCVQFPMLICYSPHPSNEYYLSDLGRYM